MNTIFEREDMHVLEVKGQHEYKNVLPYRCIIIDIRAVDSLVRYMILKCSVQMPERYHKEPDSTVR